MHVDATFRIEGSNPSVFSRFSPKIIFWRILTFGGQIHVEYRCRPEKAKNRSALTSERHEVVGPLTATKRAGYAFGRGAS